VKRLCELVSHIASTYDIDVYCHTSYFSKGKGRDNFLIFKS